MTLVLVVGLIATVGLRASMFSMNVASASRSHSLALEAAEFALRYCEQQALSTTPAVPIHEMPEAGDPVAIRWRVAASWEGAPALASTVPLDKLNTGKSKQVYGLAPQCLVERLRLPTDPDKDELGFLITARGFSPDASMSAGVLTSGSEVWVQTMVQQ